MGRPRKKIEIKVVQKAKYIPANVRVTKPDQPQTHTYILYDTLFVKPEIIGHNSVRLLTPIDNVCVFLFDEKESVIEAIHGDTELIYTTTIQDLTERLLQ